MQPRIIHVASHLYKTFGFEWLYEYLSDEFKPGFVLLNSKDSEFERWLIERGAFVRRMHYRDKWDLPAIALKLWALFVRMRPYTVHVHFWDAAFAALTAAKLAGVRQRIYTRHYCATHHVYQPKMIRIDRYINTVSTDILAISRAVEYVLLNQERVKGDKITVIPHGFDFERIARPSRNLAPRYNPSGRSPVIGVISRYTHSKGLQNIIPAVASLLDDYPNLLLVLANAAGDYAPAVKKLLQQNLPSETYVEIPFESDVFSLYRLFDVYVHVPIDPYLEAFGQTYVEAPAAGVPCVFTLSGIALEFVRHMHNAYVVAYNDPKAIADGIRFFLQNPEERKRIVANARRDVQSLFDIRDVVKRYEALYAKARSDFRRAGIN
ncbi:MAG: glycosyltransferase family 4 protein [Bacteroidia bacterium]|nr:glycosyltransferase family 4 protein [Bacteroidia bacterium]